MPLRSVQPPGQEPLLRFAYIAASNPRTVSMSCAPSFASAGSELATPPRFSNPDQLPPLRRRTSIALDPLRTATCTTPPTATAAGSDESPLPPSACHAGDQAPDSQCCHHSCLSLPTTSASTIPAAGDTATTRDPAVTDGSGRACHPCQTPPVRCWAADGTVAGAHEHHDLAGRGRRGPTERHRDRGRRRRLRRWRRWRWRRRCVRRAVGEVAGGGVVDGTRVHAVRAGDQVRRRARHHPAGDHARAGDVGVALPVPEVVAVHLAACRSSPRSGRARRRCSRCSRCSSGCRCSRRSSRLATSPTGCCSAGTRSARC